MGNAVRFYLVIPLLGFALIWGEAAAQSADEAKRARLQQECDHRGIIESCGALAVMLADGTGGPANHDLARLYFAKACSGGNLQSCMLGSLHELVVPAQQQRAPAGGDDWDPNVYDYEGNNSPPPHSKHWEGHHYWCWTNTDFQFEDGGFPTWCTDETGGTWEQSLFDKCDGVEGWCD